MPTDLDAIDVGTLEPMDDGTFHLLQHEAGASAMTRKFYFILFFLLKFFVNCTVSRLQNPMAHHIFIKFPAVVSASFSAR